jgi:hypothetical protein
LFFAGQTVFGWLNYNDEKNAQHQPQIGFVQYLGLEPSARLSSKSAAVSDDSLLEDFARDLLAHGWQPVLAILENQRVTAAPRRRHKSGAGPETNNSMNYGDRLRDTVIPEMQGSTAKGCRAGNFPVVGFLSLEGDTWGKGSSQPLASHKPKVQSNDIVEFDKQPGTWEVVAPVNGSKFAEAEALTLASLQPG